MSDKVETKHQAFNLNMKDHPNFIDQQVIVDSDGDVFLWINKYTGNVSFGGKYFHSFKEQQLVQSLEKFMTIAHEYLEQTDSEERECKFYKELESAFEKGELALSLYARTDGER